jgi:FkbM family methyltransferase
MIVNLRDKALTVASGRNDAYWQAIDQGKWEPATFRVFDRFVDREHSYIDMGAFVGPTLLYGCQIARRAYGIEPDPIAYAELRQNIDGNRPVTDNVQLFEVCIAPRAGEVAFGNCGAGGDSVSSLLFGNRKTHWTVKALTFEDFIRQNNIVDCNFIKIDIEGGEYQLLPTMLDYLKVHRPTVYLSLHPCHLGKRRIGWIGKVVARAAATLKIRKCLQVYKYLYDGVGRPITFRHLLRICLARVTFEVVMTDLEWDAAAAPP